MRLTTFEGKLFSSLSPTKTPTTLNGFIHFSYSILFLVIFLLGSLQQLQGQETVDDIFDLPAPERCVSNDLRVVEASLEFDECGPTCVEGEIIEYPLTLAIFNNTGSERTSFAFYARLEQYNPDGTLANTYFISGCKGPVPPNTTTSLTFDESLVILDEEGNPTSFEGVPYLCGGSLELINLYEAWTDASDNENRECPLDASMIAPKCDVLPSIEIQTPLSAIVEDTTDVSCFEGEDGAIDITVSGGEGPYEFVWSKVGGGFSADTEDVSGLSAGTYSVTITDSQDCFVTLDGIIIGQPTDVVATLDTIVPVSCFDGEGGSISISVAGGTGPYTYAWTGPDSFSADTQDITGLAAGTYAVTVTDANGCIEVLDGLIVTEPAELVATLDVIVPVSCFGGEDGSISIAVTGGTSPYTYEWTGPDGFTATTEDISGLAAGNYEVTVTDDNGCTATLDELIVTEPDELVITLGDVEGADCFGDTSGSIAISVAGGTSPYTYAWTGPDGFTATTEDITGLAAGTYAVTVTDDNDCSASLENIIVGEPDGLSVTLNSTDDVSCFDGSDGALNIDVEGGTTPYTFSWTGPDGFTATTEDITGLAAGTYAVTVTDANGCTISLTGLEVDEPLELVATLDAIVPVSCFEGEDGSITIDVAGGTSPYTYEWTGPDGFTATTEDISGLAAGNYEVTVTDDNGCTVTLDELIVTEPDELVATLGVVDGADCFGDTSGSISISVAGGTGPYEFSWTGPDGFTATTEDITGLAAGTYAVVVTDANGCTDTLSSIVVGQPDGLMVTLTSSNDVSCFGESDGSIDITVTGGTSPYSFSWTGPDGFTATTEDVSGLEDGTYSVTVTDDAGCEFTLSNLIIGEPTEVPSPQVQVAPADCIQTSGAFSIVNAPADFEYSLDGGPWFTYTGTITGVSPGAHSLVARDANECESQPTNFDVPQPFETPSAPVLSVIQPDCETLTGTILVTSGTTGFMFSINGGDFVAYPTDGFTGLTAGDYVVRARSNDGCISDTTEVTLIAPICDDFEGCTLGYWKNHTDRWCDAYLTCDLYGEVFMNAPSSLADLTLLEVLNLGGGGINNLGRQSVAALLNACSMDVNFELATPQDVIDYVNENFDNAGVAGANLDIMNNSGCPLGGTRANRAPSDECSTIGVSEEGNNNGNSKGNSKASEDKGAGFTVSPVPFRDNLEVEFKFNYKSDAVIQIFDMGGNMVKSVKVRKASSGDRTSINADFVRGEQVYIVQVKTDRDTFTKSVISAD